MRYSLSTAPIAALLLLQAPVPGQIAKAPASAATKWTPPRTPWRSGPPGLVQQSKRGWHATRTSGSVRGTEAGGHLR